MSTRAGERIALEEGAGAEQADFLALVEQEGDRPRRAAGRAAGAAISSIAAMPIPSSVAPGPAGVRIVMGDEQHVPALGRPDRRDEVADPGAGDGAAAADAVAGEIVGDARIEARRARISAISRSRTASFGVAVDRVRPLVAEDALRAAPARDWRRSAGAPLGRRRREGRAGRPSAPSRRAERAAIASKCRRLLHPPLPCAPRRMPYRLRGRSCDRGGGQRIGEMKWVIGWSSSARPAMSGARC